MGTMAVVSLPLPAEPRPQDGSHQEATDADVAMDDSSSDEDFDRLPEDTGPPLDAGYTEHDPTEEQSEAIARWRSEATEAQANGDLKLAVARYSKVISCGGSSALTLTKRSELLLKQGRPCAAIQDCTAALA